MLGVERRGMRRGFVAMRDERWLGGERERREAGGNK